MELKKFKNFKKFQVFEPDFFKLQFPPESNDIFPANFFLTSVPAVLGERNGNGRTFFNNDGLLPNSSESRLKIFVSERMSDPSPTCLRGATPTKSLPGACGVLLMSFNNYSTIYTIV